MEILIVLLKQICGEEISSNYIEIGDVNMNGSRWKLYQISTRDTSLLLSGPEIEIHPSKMLLTHTYEQPVVRPSGPSEPKNKKRNDE